MNIVFSSYGEFNKQRPIGPAEWPHFDLLFIHHGKVCLDIENQAPLMAHTGQAILIFPHTPFQGSSISETTKASVHHFQLSNPNLEMTYSPLKSYYDRQQGFEFFDSSQNPDIVKDLERSLRIRDYLPNQAAQAMQCHLLCLSLVQLQHNPQRSSLHAQPRLHEALFKLRDCLSSNLNRALTLSEMADRVNLSASHLRRLFKQQLGISPVQYHQQLRMEEASRLLRESTLPIKAISTQLGFDDIAHFYRCFKKFADFPPAEYRNKFSPLG